MGYLTTFTVYNDGVDQIEQNPVKFAEVVRDATKSFDAKEYGLGNHCNLIKAQRPRHSSDKAVYVHMGNTVIDCSLGSDDLRNLMVRNPEFVKKILGYLEDKVEYLKSLLESAKCQSMSL